MTGAYRDNHIMERRGAAQHRTRPGHNRSGNAWKLFHMVEYSGTVHDSSGLVGILYCTVKYSGAVHNRLGRMHDRLGRRDIEPQGKTSQGRTLENSKFNDNAALVVNKL